MVRQGYRIYLETRKKNDQIFNHYVMRPVAGVVVFLLAKTPVTPNQITIVNLFVFLVSAALLIVLPGYSGALIAMAVLEFSYLLDCADGMLARHKKIASQTGHLFDLFTDELKAVVLVACLGVRFSKYGGNGPNFEAWSSEAWLVSALIGVVVLASATSLTNFTRRPELTGKDTPIAAHYETVEEVKPKSLVGRAVGLGFMFLRFLNHYPSHIYLWAIVSRLDLFFWIYVSINTLYLAQGWLSLLLRFGRN